MSAVMHVDGLKEKKYVGYIKYVHIIYMHSYVHT